MKRAALLCLAANEARGLVTVTASAPAWGHLFGHPWLVLAGLWLVSAIVFVAMWSRIPRG